MNYSKARRIAAVAAALMMGQLLTMTGNAENVPAPESITEPLTESMTELQTEEGDGRTLPVTSQVTGDNGEILPDTVGEAKQQETQADTEFHLDIDYILSYDQKQCSDMIFCGDSRVVGMSYYAGGYHYVGKTSMGYSWLCGEGSAWMESMMNEWPQADVVMCFGINDLGNVGAYISYYQALMDRYPLRRFWFMAVNPVSERTAAANGYSVRNSMIEAFNSQLQSAFPDRYLDTYSYLMKYGVGTGDGIHYDGTTYAALEDDAWREITKKLEEENKNQS